jgi:mannose-1-phosphate guanylyltransferase / phosphomannomutase
MKTVLLATGERSELWPLTESTACSLLPVADKALVIHTLESLAIAGLTDVIVVIGAFDGMVKERLGDGTEWGMRLVYLPLAHERSLDDLLLWLARELDQDFLLIRGDVLRTLVIAQFLEAAAPLNNAIAVATTRGAGAGAWLVKRNVSRLPTLSNNAAEFDRMTSGGAVIDFPKANLSLIESPAALHRANLEAIGGKYPGLVFSGRELSPSVRVGRKSSVPGETIKGMPVFIGARCRIAGGAELMAETVVSSDSVIDRYTTLHRAVIMPNSYVGTMLEVRDAIVAGHWLIHVDSGAHTLVTDSFLLSTIHKRYVRRFIQNWLTDFAGRVRTAISTRERTFARPDAAGNNMASKPDSQLSVNNRRELDSTTRRRDVAVNRAAHI